MNTPEKLNVERLRAGLRESLIGREIVVLDRTSSTNDVVLAMAAADPTEGLVVFAEYQSAGRGQRGNQWESAERKGLWFSVLLRPRIALAGSVQLIDWVSRSVAQTIADEFALPATIKPPNDICIDGKKVAGVLVEMRARKADTHLAILGIGINVNQSATDFSETIRPRAVSIAMMLGGPVDRSQLAIALLKTLDRTYRTERGL